MPIEFPDSSKALWRIVGPGAHEVFKAWEVLRLVYNGILAVVVLAFLLLSTKATHFCIWINIVAGALLANVCFCAGPVMEGYLTCLGHERFAIRHVLFILGLLFAVVLTILALEQPIFWEPFEPIPDR